MSKMALADIQKAYENPVTVEAYTKAVLEVGLWKSERKLIEQYFDKAGNILDLGCGAGRTTFGMFDLGYLNVTGLDLSQLMIRKAEEINKARKTSITFVQGNAMATNLPDQHFDGVQFSFNGLMQVPGKKNRKRVFLEVKRTLKSGGYFIFSTYDRNSPEHERLWQFQAEIWQNGEQDQRLYELGDVIIKRDGKDLFLHIPTRKEIMTMIHETGFSLVETIKRKELANEDPCVKKFASECVFWVVKK